jgi:hypothetical protein
VVVAPVHTQPNTSLAALHVYVIKKSMGMSVFTKVVEQNMGPQKLPTTAKLKHCAIMAHARQAGMEIIALLPIGSLPAG